MITSADIKQLAARAGFDLCGICSAEPIPEAQARFKAWLDKGCQAGMDWMTQNVERRTDPSRLGIDARSVIVLALNYYQPNSAETPTGHGRIARYARGRDYHKVVGAKIKKLLKLITTRFPETAETQKTEIKWWVDYGPFLERAYAAKAGLGFLAKNGLLISRRFGSWLVLAEIVTSLELEPDDPKAVNHGRCGKCRKCIDACPTGAIVADGVVDASLCLSYWTEEDPTHIPKVIASKIGHNPFGCDICQEICPHNNKHRSIPTAHEELTPAHGVGEFLSLEQVLSMTTREEFLDLTAGTALTRPKLEGLQHTARVVEDNQR